jgi:hypothetical protein
MEKALSAGPLLALDVPMTKDSPGCFILIHPMLCLSQSTFWLETLECTFQEHHHFITINDVACANSINKLNLVCILIGYFPATQFVTQ